jgi:hypothetical protein
MNEEWMGLYGEEEEDWRREERNRREEQKKNRRGEYNIIYVYV